MEVTSSGIINSLISLPLLSINTTGFPILFLINPIILLLQKSDRLLTGTITEVRPLQPKNASSLMDVTLFGIVTEVRPQQSMKAS